MVPYLGWLCFAAILNWEIIRLNPGAEGLVVEPGGTQIDIRR
jgi:translocator protein